MNKQTTKPSLTKLDLLKLDIELPSMNEQRTFVDFVEQADKLKFNFFIPSPNGNYSKIPFVFL